MIKEKYFQYGAVEIKHLKSKCSKLAAVIEEVGCISRAVIPDLFVALVRNIVGQQISTKAADTISSRIESLAQLITPENIAALTIDDLQKCGMSFRKASYILDIANAVLSGELDLDELHKLSDDEVGKRLNSLKGLGIWTAEMLMIFSMGRSNILSFGDLAIHRGLRMIYGLEKVDKKMFAEFKKLYTPYASTASLYLWAVAGGACSNLIDPAKK
ncbi:MAG: DNA-3-methyladenine glycosylase [Firmicutes bacterium]|nr:DNA-3-methyladenine glycosylase [Bacillota bacterium]